MSVLTIVRSSHDPFAPGVRFPEERLARALDPETVERLRTRFASLDYATARSWNESRRTVSNDDLRTLYTVPEGATVESLQERLKDDLVDLAVGLGVPTTGTKEELARAILGVDETVETEETGGDGAEGDGADGDGEEDADTETADAPAESPQETTGEPAGAPAPDAAPTETTEAPATTVEPSSAPVGEPAPTTVGEPAPEPVGEPTPATTAARRARR